MGTLDQLTRIASDAQALRARADSTEDERDELIQAARAEGFTVAQISEATRLSPPRVYQILKGTP